MKKKNSIAKLKIGNKVIYVTVIRRSMRQQTHYSFLEVLAVNDVDVQM